MARQSTLCRPVCLGVIAKYGHFLRLSQKKGAFSLQSRLHGGGRGIRTPGTVSGTVVFKTTRFNHSRIPP
jgi:hypothetical protein